MSPSCSPRGRSGARPQATWSCAERSPPHPAPRCSPGHPGVTVPASPQSRQPVRSVWCSRSSQHRAQSPSPPPRSHRFASRAGTRRAKRPAPPSPRECPQCGTHPAGRLSSRALSPRAGRSRPQGLPLLLRPSPAPRRSLLLRRRMTGATGGTEGGSPRSLSPWLRGRVVEVHLHIDPGDDVVKDNAYRGGNE